ncbi:Retroviral aspartyl protease [Corchorus olitorius]|uniref:Retroviral aspartyl protease n=1 Tax=Corchorus olitorius TaxID=93759 RepID=A0A1R3ITL2_9ROSI|nr:Retroviral aspartyl protease [Corchorus olitorius]
MAPKVDYAEAIAALTSKIQDLTTVLESNYASITTLQSQMAKMEKAPAIPPLAPIPIPPTSPSSTSQGNSQISAYQIKPPRFNLTQFDGQDPQSWIFQAEQYFVYHSIPPHQKLSVAFFFMLGEAQAKLQETRAFPYRAAAPHPNRPTLAFPTPSRASLTLPSLSQPSLALPAPPSQPPIKRLTPGEMQARRAKGLCYNCNDQYKPGDKCRTTPFLLLQVDEEESSDDIPNTDGSLSLSLASLPLPLEPQLFPEIDPSDFQVSLHALYGHYSLNTLKFVGEIAGYQFSILVDSGSTHNLIQPRLARFLQLPIQPAPPFAVTIRNGETIHCLGQMTDLRVGLQGYNFLLDLFLLEVRGADIILGIQWLSQLGPVLADFADLTLTFLHEGSFITLAGHPKIKPTVASYQQVKRLAQSDGIEMAQLVADALSRSISEEPALYVISGPVMTFLDHLRLYYSTDFAGQKLFAQARKLLNISLEGETNDANTADTQGPAATSTQERPKRKRTAAIWSRDYSMK